MDELNGFKNELETAGLIPSDITPDGVLKRCPTIDKPRSKNGWHVLFNDPLAGAFGDWQTGETKTWSGGNSGTLDPETQQRLHGQIERAKAERQAEEDRKHEAAAQEANQIIESLPDAGPENPYLKRKGVSPCKGLKTEGPTLVVPVMGPDGGIQSLQRIIPDGEKRFLTGGKTKGGYFAIKGDNGALYIGEGVATGLSIHKATGNTVLTAFDSGNLQVVAEFARNQYPDREIIICGDDDVETLERTGRNPGVIAANEAATAIDAKLIFPTFTDHKEKSDFNDMAAEQGLEAVKGCLEQAKAPENSQIARGAPENSKNEWVEPLPIIEPSLNNTPYPIEALPDTICEVIGEVTGFVQAPIEMVAMSALTAISTVTAGLVDVERSVRLKGPSSLYMLAVADSGERKSTLDAFFSKAIRDYESEEAELMKPEISTYRAALATWEARKNGLLNAIKDTEKRGKNVDDLEERLKNLEAAKPERPRLPRLLVGDSTTEALTWRLSDGWPVAGLLSSEGGLIFGAYSMGKETVMRNLSTLNALWGAEPMSIERRTSESFSIHSARLTVGISVQGETIKRFIEGTRGLARGSGFLARFLIAMPQTRQGYRPFQEPPENWPCLARFHRRLAALLDEPLNLNVYGDLEPRTLTLSPEAKKIWIAFHNDIEAELLPGGELEETKDIASKAADNVARLAALFHCFDAGLNGTISPEHITNAARLVAWHLIEAKRFIGDLAISEEVSNAAKLDAWLIDHCKKNHVKDVKTTHALQFGPHGMRRKRLLDAAIYELEDLGRIRRRIEGRTVSLIINPGLLEAI